MSFHQPYTRGTIVGPSAAPPVRWGMNGVSTGPGHGPVPPGPGGLYPEANPYVPYFGHVDLGETRYGKSRENYDLSDAYTRQPNLYMSKVVIDSFSEDKQFLNREVLPFTKNETNDSIEWDVLTFNPAMLNRRPEEAVSRQVTSKKKSFRAAYVSFGIMLRLEMGFFNTAEGRMHYAYHLEQLKQAVLRTAGLGAAEALLSQPPPEDSSAEQHGRKLSRPEFERLLRTEVANWGAIQKDRDGLQMLGDHCRMVLLGRGVEPNYTIMPMGAAKYMRAAERRVPFIVKGPNGGEYPNYEGFGRVVESISFKTGEDAVPYDPFFRNSTIGSFFFMDYHNDAASPEFYRSYMRDCGLWSEDADDWVKHNIVDVLRNSGVYDPDDPGCGLLELGSALLGDHPSWYDYLKDQDVANDVIKCITLRKQEEFNEFLANYQAELEACGEQKAPVVAPAAGGPPPGRVSDAANIFRYLANYAANQPQADRLLQAKLPALNTALETIRTNTPRAAPELMINLALFLMGVAEMGASYSFPGPTPQALYQSAYDKQYPGGNKQDIKDDTVAKIVLYAGNFNGNELFDTTRLVTEDIWNGIMGPIKDGTITTRANLLADAEYKQLYEAAERFVNGGTAGPARVDLTAPVGGRSAYNEYLDGTAGEVKVKVTGMTGPGNRTSARFSISQAIKDGLKENKVPASSLRSAVKEMETLLVRNPDFFDEYGDSVIRALLSHVVLRSSKADQEKSLGTVKLAFKYFVLAAAAAYDHIKEEMDIHWHSLQANRHFDGSGAGAGAGAGASATDPLQETYSGVKRLRSIMETPEGKSSKRNTQMQFEGFNAWMRMAAREPEVRGNTPMKPGGVDRKDVNNTTADDGGFYVPLAVAWGNMALTTAWQDNENEDYIEHRLMQRQFMVALNAQAAKYLESERDAISTYVETGNTTRNNPHIGGRARYGPSPMNTTGSRANYGFQAFNTRDMSNVEAFLRTVPPRDGRFLEWCATHDVKLPLSFLVFAPHISFETGTMIMCRAGRELGATFHGFEDYMLGKDPAQKMIYGHLTMKMKPLIINPALMHRQTDMYVRNYLGGGGHEVYQWNDMDVTEYSQGRLEENRTNDLYACGPSKKCS